MGKESWFSILGRGVVVLSLLIIVSLRGEIKWGCNGEGVLDGFHRRTIEKLNFMNSNTKCLYVKSGYKLNHHDDLFWLL